MRSVTLQGLTFQVDESGFERFWDKADSGRWEPSTIRLLRTCIRHGDVYVDVGGWIGPTVLLAAAFTDHVYAFEPDPVAFRTLEKNVALNPDLREHIALNEAAIWTCDGEVELRNSKEFGDSTSSLVLDVDAITASTHAVTLESARSQFVGERVDFIKVDIEGGEYSLIPAWATYLSQHRPTLFVSMHSAYLMKHTKGWRPWVLLRLVWKGLKLYSATSHYRYRYVVSWHQIQQGRLFDTLAAIIHSDKSVLFTDRSLAEAELGRRGSGPDRNMR
ncbi:MAG: FkbM family methyltransferase [Gammaproteobacteria bacterium]|nr:FkbM family methyltransferase [Gammaproteobacteria bacterium]